GDGRPSRTSGTGFQKRGQRCAQWSSARAGGTRSGMPSDGGPGWIPQGGFQPIRPSGRSPPGSRKNCHYRYGPPPFSGGARVPKAQDEQQSPDGRRGAGYASPVSPSADVGSGASPAVSAASTSAAAV